MIKMDSIRKTAGFAGLWYLIMGIGTGFSMGYVDRIFYIPGDVATTINNIQTLDWLLRLGIASNLIGLISFIFLALALYKLFKAVDKDQARLMIILIFISIPITCINMVNQLVPILFLSGTGYFTAFTSAQLQTLSMVFLDIHQKGIYIACIFWGLWLFPLGYLVIKSGAIPKVLGILLMIGGFGYLINSLVNLLFPNLKSITSMGPSIGGIAEIIFLFWLLIRGVNTNKWDVNALESDQISNGKKD